ncbi:ABC transporter ATP-binding protein, partial [Actinomyces gerencseriae]
QPAPGPPTPPTDVVVEARDLTKVYGSGEARVAALDGVSLTVSRGQFVAVMGPSGSGKSTLLHCLAGLDTPASGHVLIAGRDLAGMNDKQLTAVRRDQLGFVFQAFNLLPTLTAEENILLPTRLAHRTPDPNWQNAVIAALGIGDRLTHRPAELSGGQQQRVAIARALIGRPQVVFADEPTGALDTASAASLLQALARMCDNLGQTVVMVTHDENAGAAAPAGWVTPAGPATPTGTAGTAAPAGPAGPATPAGPTAPTSTGTTANTAATGREAR